MVTQEAEAAAQLAVSASLSMSANVNISALAMRDEEAIHLEEAIQFSKTEADSAIDEGLVCGSIQDFEVVADILVSRLHVDQDVVTGGRRGTAVLVTTTLDCYGYLVVFGVLDCYFAVDSRVKDARTTTLSS
jgi:hypothetical protein